MEAGKYVVGGNVTDTRKCAGNVDGDVLHAEEPWVIAAVGKEELEFETRVRVGEHAVLGLEDGADAFAKGNDIESHKEVVVHQSNDAL